jgi:tetratricopeptide (TPR) repeat protein
MGQELSHTFRIACLVLVLATLAVYSSGVRNNSFVDLDDGVYVTQNPYVQQGLAWKTFAWALTSTHRSGNWHPLTWLSHALDCQLYGLNPCGHHLTNVLFHVLNALILFSLLARVTGATGRSFLVAALFALHPMNVESVAWVAERKNVLSTLFFLLALGTYGWYAVKPDLKRYVTVTVFFVLALASKPMVITLPFVLLLLDFWPLQRVWKQNYPQPGAKEKKRRKERSKFSLPGSPFPVVQLPFWQLVREKLPWVALCAASAIVTIIAQKSTGAIEATTRTHLGIRLENAINSYVGYIAKAFWPAHLAVYYPYPYKGIAIGQVALASLFLLGISGLTWRQHATRPYLLTGWLWYLGTLVPVIGFIQVGNQAMADRYGYLPLIGIFVMTVWGLAEFADRNKINLSLRAATATIVFGLLSFLSWRQIGYWRSDYALWSNAVRVTKNNVLAEASLGRALRSLDRPQEALPHYEQAARLSPGDPVRHLNLAVYLAECGRLQDAIEEYQAATHLTSDDKILARTYESLGALFGALGDYAKVHESYRQALQLDPSQADEMVRHLSQSIASQPTSESYLQLGMLLQEMNKLAEARVAYQQALELDPTLTVAKESLAVLQRSDK